MQKPQKHVNSVLCFGFFSPFLGWSVTESTVTEATTGLLLTAPDDDECGVIRGMVGRGNGSTRRKSFPVPLCLPQIPHDLIRTRARLPR
jgi:hypothetical protein